MTDKEKLKYQQFYNHVAGLSEVPMGYSAGGTLSIDEAFGVYAQGYIARLTDALGENYESIWKFAGDEIFFEISEDYIRKNPSMTYNLNDYGASFPDYLKSLPAQSDYPFLYDLSLLDQARNFLFHQKSEVGLEGTQVQSVLKETSKLSFVSSMLFLKSEFDLKKIWRDISDEKFNLENLAEYQTPVTSLVFKDGDITRIMTLSAKAGEALTHLQIGQELTQALRELEPKEVTELFKNLMTYNLIRDVVG